MKANTQQISDMYCNSLKDYITDIAKKHNLTEHIAGFFESETHLHVDRVTKFSCFIAEKLKLKQDEIELLEKIAALHDFGKLKIPQEILAKPGRLTNEEFEIIKQHPQIGYELLRNSGSEVLDLAALVSLQHHENFDGSGYPCGLRGEEIHLYSRIIAAADVLDSLASARCYKQPWSKAQIRAFFEYQRGKKFDPKVADIVLEYFEELWRL